MRFAVACAASFASIWLNGGPDQPVLLTPPPATSPPTELIHLGGGHPGAIALADTGVWVTVYAGRGRNRVVAIDPATRRVKARIPVRGGPFYIAASDGAVWVTGNFTRRGDVLHRIDPVAKRVVATIPLPGRFAGPIAVGPRSVWVLATNHDVTRQWLVRIDPATNEIVRSVSLPTTNVEDLRVGERFVWLLALKAGRIGELPGDVLRFDPRTSRVTGRIDAEALTLGVGPGGIWVSGCVECGRHRRTYFAQKLAARAGRLAGPRIAVRRVAFGPLFVGRDRVWFGGYGRSGGPIAFSVDPESGQIDRFLRLGGFLYSGMALDPRRHVLWVAKAAGGVLRVDLARR
jgi:YVTN family beta-propeller protein